jgi:glutamine synthetase
MDAFELTRFELMSLARRNKVKFIELQFTDIAGMVKNLVIPANELDASLAKGIWFDGSSIEGYARVAESDMYLMPDPATFAILPWGVRGEATARLICNVHTPDDQPFGGDPRAALMRVLAEGAEMGFSYSTSPEMEFFLLKAGPTGEALVPLCPHDSAGYFDASSDEIAGLRADLMSGLSSFGIKAEAMHHEVAAGQHEVDFASAPALAAADGIITFRLALKATARRFGLYGTFMPKPIKGMSGNGMHIHQCMSYAATGRDAFLDPGDPHGLSKTARHFIAGQLAHAKGMCAVLAPLVNSYKRLVAGYEAPVHISWARVNRSALIRVPRSTEDSACRLELRCPDPSCNPYLALAVMLAAGLDGIRREIPPVEATEENPYLAASSAKESKDLLPSSLEAAIEALEEDAVVRSALGPYICNRFLEAKRLEWTESYTEVTPWEIAKYLPNF